MTFHAHQADFILLDNNKDKNSTSFLLHELKHELSIHSNEEPEPYFQQLEKWLDQGLFIGGYVTYEAASLFDPYLPSYKTNQDKLAYFGAFSKLSKLNHKEVETFLATKCGDTKAELQLGAANRSQQEYLVDFAKTKAYIFNGDTYQINYSIEIPCELNGDPYFCYTKLRQEQAVEYGAMINMPSALVLSRSPELFFKKTDSKIKMKPMKGTAIKTLDEQKNLKITKNLLSDSKTISENVMIVDLLRNDVGRISEPDTLRVDKLLELETYKTLYQLTSSLSCQVDKKISLFDIFKALFPCGSISGVPKKRSMEIILELEKRPRGIFTGAIGYITPARDMCFNVAIRTLEFYNGKKARFGVGGGIVNESVALSEYQECYIKSKFLNF